MLTGFSSLRSFHEGLGALDSSLAIQNFFMDTVERLGFRNFAYHVIQTPDVDNVGVKQTFGISTYAKEWSQHYISNGYVNEDPVIAKVYEERTPFVWSDSIQLDDLSRKQRKLLDDARGVGITNGLTVPLVSRVGEVASLSLIPGEISIDEMRSAEVMNLVYLLARYLHDHASRIVIEERLTNSSKRRKSLLSPRESEALTWVARGKSTWDIARILDISEKSVEFHLDSVKRKLQATNRTQAVVKVIVLGLINFKP